ncbi:MAG: CRP/FNR family cyclic AMP-dependent transcriptional regulator [Myxococcota bacterium]|jgi:CRP/FNR family cyclic AMP-dependent transcriptional regulator
MDDGGWAELRRCPVFEPLTDSGLRTLLGAGRVEHRPAGALVLEEGVIGPRVMVVLSGSVQIDRREIDGSPMLIGRLGPGDVVGEIGFLLGAPRTATVRALEPLTVFALDRVTYDGLVEEGEPAALRLGLELARLVARRLVGLNHQVVELLGQSSPAAREAFLNAREAAAPGHRAG